MSYNVICDRCGFQYKDDELRKEWTGLMVCDPCFDHRHPQELIRARPDQHPLPYTRPENLDIDVGIAVNQFVHNQIPEGTFTTNNETALDDL